MILSEYLQVNHKPTDIIYLGGVDSSGFFYIGIAAKVPSRYFNIEVIESYPHTVDHPGTNILIESDERGKYWFYSEADHHIKKPTYGITCSDEKLEGLLFGIAKQCASDYRAKCRDKIASYKKKNDNMIGEPAVRRIFRDVKRSNDWTFLKQSATGRQIMQQIEDEETVYVKYPELEKMTDYDKKNRILMKHVQEMRDARVRQASIDRYATINGRSVAHV